MRRQALRRAVLVVPALLAMLSVASSLRAEPTTFRATEMYLRDPHVFARVLILCLDITDSGFQGAPSVNQTINTMITIDADTNGYLDLNFLITFDPLDQSAPGGELVLRSGMCTAPLVGTVCYPDTLGIQRVNYTNSRAGSCLAPHPGTTGGYSPGITTPLPPCFVTEPLTVPVDLGGTIVLLEGGQVAARYSGNPATGLMQGLLAGFLSEAAADTIIIPPEIPLIGGQPLSRVLPGGTGCCSSRDDRDLGPDGVTVGWWFYLNFTAEEVPFEAPTEVPVAAATGPTLRFDRIMPNPFGEQTTIAYVLASAGPVRLSVHDASGRLVARLVEGVEGAGEHAVAWSGRDDAGRALAPGVYFVRLAAGSEAVTEKLLLRR